MLFALCVKPLAAKAVVDGQKTVTLAAAETPIGVTAETATGSTAQPLAVQQPEKASNKQASATKAISEQASATQDANKRVLNEQATAQKSPLPQQSSDSFLRAPVSKVPEPVFSWGGYFKALGLMLIILGCLWLALWLLRKYGKFRFMPAPSALPHDALHIEAQLPLGPKRGLIVVRFLDSRVLLGVSDQHITFLASQPVEKAAQNSATQGNTTAESGPVFAGANTGQAQPPTAPFNGPLDSALFQEVLRAAKNTKQP